RRLVVEGCPPASIRALASTSDGAIALLYASASGDGKETSFRAARTITVTLTDSDGSPVAGWFLNARNQGNNPLGTPARTDAAGHATLGPFYGQLVEVYAGS